jgi:CDP-diacylglycerol--serine O-phosphatidyltransferase
MYLWYFRGIPIPPAGLALAGIGFYLYSNAWITLILAFLMVSPIRVKKAAHPVNCIRTCRFH